MKLQSNSMMGFKVLTPLVSRLRRQRGNRSKYGEHGRGVLLTAVQLWSANGMPTYHFFGDQTPNLSATFCVTFLPFAV